MNATEWNQSKIKAGRITLKVSTSAKPKKEEKKAGKIVSSLVRNAKMTPAEANVRQTTSFNDFSIEAGILLREKQTSQ